MLALSHSNDGGSWYQAPRDTRNVNIDPVRHHLTLGMYPERAFVDGPWPTMTANARCLGGAECEYTLLSTSQVVLVRLLVLQVHRSRQPLVWSLSGWCLDS